MPISARVRRFFRVPRDRAIPPPTIIRLELLLVGLPVGLFVIARAEGFATPLWLLAVTAVLCYGAGLAAAVLLVGDFQRRLDRGAHTEPQTSVSPTSARLAASGAPIGAVVGTWLSTRGAESSWVAVIGLLLLVSAGLIRGVMILDLPKVRS